MEYRLILKEAWRVCTLTLLVVLYVIGLVVWVPLFLVWPRRYAGLTFPETVAVRFLLVRHILTTLSGRRYEPCGHALPEEWQNLRRRRTRR